MVYLSLEKEAHLFSGVFSPSPGKQVLCAVLCASTLRCGVGMCSLIAVRHQLWWKFVVQFSGIELHKHCLKICVVFVGSSFEAWQK